MAKAHPRVIAIIGARLNSSRLPGKHLLDLAGEPLIARLFSRLESVPDIDTIVLATTNEDGNKPLLEWATQAGKTAYAYQGEVNDLVGRVNTVVQEYNAEIVVYICGDSPLIEPNTLQKLIKALLQNPTAETAMLSPDASSKPFIHEGFDIYRRSLWEQIAEYSTSPEHREHVGSVMKSWRFPVNCIAVEEEPIFASIQHRLSVDTLSDYHFMQRVYLGWYTDNPTHSLVSLPWVIEQLKRDPDLKAINHHVHQKALGERTIKAIILTCTDERVGLGHLSRAMTVYRLLQDHLACHVEMLIVGNQQLLEMPYRTRWFVSFSELKLMEYIAPDSDTVFVMDWPWRAYPIELSRISAVTEQVSAAIAIDAPSELQDAFDRLYIPSFTLKEKAQYHSKQVIYGWECYLFKQPMPPGRWQAGNEVLVLIGGSDPHGLSRHLPELLDQSLPINICVRWVQGPYSRRPRIPASARLRWQVETGLNDLSDCYRRANYVLCVYGVSFFESLQAGLPTVVFSPYGERDQQELEAIREMGIAHVENSYAEAVQALVRLIEEPLQATRMAALAAETLRPARGEALIKLVRELIASE